MGATLAEEVAGRTRAQRGKEPSPPGIEIPATHGRPRTGLHKFFGEPREGASDR